MSNVVAELTEFARSHRGEGDWPLHTGRPMGENHAKASGLDYAAGFIAARIEQILDERSRMLCLANQEPLDCQEQDKQDERLAEVRGLEKALAILGVETTEPSKG